MISDMPRLLVELRDINVSYGNLMVLKNLSLSINREEIHAIVGEHGAGKSSLARVLSGMIQSEGGTILWKNQNRQFPDVNASRNMGIELVSQDTELFNYQSVAYNLFANRQSVFPKGIFRHGKIISYAEEILSSMGVSVPAWKKAADLNLSERVLIDIVRHLYTKPELLILDEALEKLAAVDLIRIRNHLRKLAEGGSSVLFITHRIDDIYELADRVTIIRDGRAIITEPVQDIDKVSLIKLAYTQVFEDTSRQDINREFYEFLKYNEAILERLPVNLIVVDHLGSIKLMNKEALDYLGMADHSPFGKHIIELLPSLRGGMEAISEGRPYTAFDLGLDLGNARHIIDLVLSPIKDGLRYIGCIIIINDITERQRLRERIVFSERLASVGLLAAGVAHEINNPLETIYRCADTLKLSLGEPAMIKTVERLESEAEAIEHIVRNLISFGDEEGIEMDNVDLSELLNDLINLISYNTRHRKITIDWKQDSAATLVRCNKIEMKQVILNLFKNAIDAMPEGGALRISVKQEDGMAELAVEDTGPGISPDDVKSIFLPFYSTKRGVSGHMGLGLSIAYNIIKKMNGDIIVENLKPQGCRFAIRLPQL
jgi:PAS domain S-box-containing protein